MKSLRFPLRLSLALATLLTLLGCATGVSTRIEEKATAFGQLDEWTQQHLRNGQVEYGFSKDMVYIALGQPSVTENRQAADGMVEVWIYKNMTLPNGGFGGITFNTDITITPEIAHDQAISSGSVQKEFSQTDNNDSLKSGQLADMSLGTLYLFFFEGRVYKIVMKT